MKKIILASALFIAYGMPAMAQDAEPDKEKNVYQLEEVAVEEEKKDLGKNTIGTEELDIAPNSTNSLTGALQGLSNIQFGYESDSAASYGEIAPPSISISGAKTYENNFMIDGMSINNDLDPSGFSNSNQHNDMNVSGGDTTIFYNTNLMDSITVLSSNVPAKYGSFLGGVVEAELKDPQTDKWHFNFNIKHTRDEWVNLENRGEKDRFGGDLIESDPYDTGNMLEFRIWEGSFTAEGPITDNTSLLLSAARKQSILPLARTNNNDDDLGKDDQYRTNDNFFAKVMVTPTSQLKITADATYAPYQEKKWRASWPDSDWSTENDSWRFTTQAEYDFTDIGVLSGKLAYAMNGYSKDADSNLVYTLLDRVNDITENGGGTGDTEIDNKEFTLDLDFDSHEFDAGWLQWAVSLGLTWQYKTTDSWREAATADVSVVINPIYSIRTISNYDAFSQSNHLNTLGFYSEAKLTWDRLTLTPGFRIDYDDFSENTNIAPRLKAEFDTFGDGRLRLIGGLNRYYGGQLRAYAFDRSRPGNVHQVRTINRIDFIKDYTTGDNDFSSANLDTPYSDEVTGGIAGAIGGFTYGIEVVLRDHEDQLISRSDDGDNYYMTNDGKSRYEGITLSLGKAFNTREFGNHTFLLSATTSNTETFNGAYDSNIFRRDSYGYEYNYNNVYYNGDYISRSDLPADDYNSPWKLALKTSSSFAGDRVRLSTTTTWSGDSEGLMGDRRVSNDTPYGTTRGSNTRTSDLWVTEDGRYVNALTEGTIEGGLITDLAVEWDVYQEFMS